MPVDQIGGGGAGPGRDEEGSGRVPDAPPLQGTAEPCGPPAQAAAESYRPTPLTTPTRARERVSYDRELVHSILDATYLCHLGFVVDGAPVVLPTLYGRVGERLYLHGSTGSRPLRAASPGAQAGSDPRGEAEGATGSGAHGAGPGSSEPGSGAGASPHDDPGLRVCVTVTLVDGIVLARSAFHHSINYRSVVIHGIAHQVVDPDERSVALDALVNHVVPGRAEDSRPGSAKELAATAVIRLDLREVSAKVRSGGPSDEPDDIALPYWSGVLPVVSHFGSPVPADDLAPGIPVPDYLTARP